MPGHQLLYRNLTMNYLSNIDINSDCILCTDINYKSYVKDIDSIAVRRYRLFCKNVDNSRLE